MKGRGRQILFALSLSGLSALFIAVAINEIFSQARYRDLALWAARLESGYAVDTPTMEVLVSQSISLMREGECRSRFVKSGMSVLLVNIDGKDQVRDYENWVLALQQAEEFTVYALSCLPTDGNFWLRMGMIRQAIAEEADEVSRLITLSSLYAPAEEQIIAARYLLYNRLAKQTLEKLGRALHHDLSIICAETATGSLRTLPQVGAVLRPYVKTFFPTCRVLDPARLFR